MGIFKRHWPMILLLVAYFILGFTKYQEFGIPSNYKDFFGSGVTYLQSLTGKKVDLANYQIINPTISSTNGIFPAVLMILNFKKDMYFFTLLNIFLFSALLVFAYGVLYRKYMSNILALLGPLFMLLQPRLLGHAVIDPQNMIFTILFFISLTAILYLNKKRNAALDSFFLKSMILGILFGATQSQSVFAYALYFVYFLQTLHILIYKYSESSVNTKKTFVRNALIEFVTITVFAHFVMALLLPINEVPFLFKLSELFSLTFIEKLNMEHNLYFGNFEHIHSGKYLGIHFLLTTPVIILALLPLAFYFIRKKAKDEIFSIYISICIGFAIFFAFVNINVQTGIQDILFLLPIVAMLCAMILIELIMEAKDTSLKNIFSLLVFISMLGTSIDIIRIHPYEYIYFNELTGSFKNGIEYFEGDYLGISYKEAVDKIKAYNKFKSTEKSVYACENMEEVISYAENVFIITDKKTDADYFICTKPVYDIEAFSLVTRDGAILNTISRVSF